MLMRLAIVCLVLGITADLRGQNKDSEKEIRAAYHAYYAAIRQRDVDGAMKFCTSDYAEYLRNGVVLDYAGEAESTKELISGAKTIGDTRVDIKELQDQGGDVTVTVREVFFYALSPDAKPTSFADDLSRDTWTRTPQGWKIRKSVHLTDINGSLTPASVPPQSPRLQALLEDWNAGKTEALAAFWKSVEGKAPLVEDMKSDQKQGDRPMLLVTFLWRSDSVEKVTLGGGLPHESPHPLTRLADTDVWYLTELMPADSRGTYEFAVEGFFNGPTEHFRAIAPDPLNPKAFGRGSYFELPNAPVQPYIKKIPGVSHGKLTKLKIKSTILNEKRDYDVYTPAGYSTKDQPYNLLLLFDGEDYGNGVTNLVPTPTILDNLVAQKKIPPTILVLVNAGSSRIRDLSCSQTFAGFLAKELLPELRTNYRVTADPKHVVVGGSSLGGLASACAGLMHPEAFGNILSLSGAYWYIPGWEKMGGSLYLGDSGWVMRQYLQGPKLPLRFYIDVGRYEEKQLSTNRNFRDILKLKGYPVTYSEFDGGHDYLCWRGSVADGLIALFGPGH
ncbi:MAG TPA: alpha/beta hydrolase-fold protein [Candidatus Angelobacter sp.]|nr:alpha/beta hydrolase-fold protein [Candidatus Angelobacter sp.]